MPNYSKNLFEKIFFEEEQLQTHNFESRQILTMKFALWTNLIYQVGFVLIMLAFDPKKIQYQSLWFIVFLSLVVYLLKKNYINAAKFFSYFPIVFIHFTYGLDAVSRHLVFTNENILYAYLMGCIVWYSYPRYLYGILWNMLLFFTIKFYKFQEFPIPFTDFFVDIVVSLAVYIMITYLALLYKHDVYKLKEKNEIIESQTEELKTLNSTKNRLFSIIAHDLREPLTSLKYVMQLLDTEYISKEEFKELSKRLQQNMDNVHGMLENLLLWSLSQMDGIKPNIKAFDLNFVVDETVMLFKEVFTQKHIDLTSNSTLSFSALGDEFQIRTVLRNVLNNAIKFTPENGRILIESKVEKNFIHLKISDSGIGISKEDLPIFFSNPKLQTGTAGEKGTGFGLFLCKELVEKNGGLISVDSEFGKWTTIKISLPLMMN